MKKIFFILLLSPLFLSAQTDTSKGINWTTGLSWEQVKQKAKTENKFIFIDAYTTWCGPCKAMDKEVYSARNVGDALNQKFLSIKVQIDTSKQDNDVVKKWYADADLIERDYKITAFPTFLFFSSEGQLVHRGVGLKSVDEFIALANDASDPKTQFYTLLEQYKSGKRDYSALPGMIKNAKRFEKNVWDRILAKDYLNNFLYKQAKNQIYKRVNLLIIGEFMDSVSEKGFKLFFSNQQKIDSIIGLQSYAQSRVDDVIYKEYIKPTLDQTEKTVLDPNWDVLHNSIKKKFGSKYAERITLAAQLNWYNKKKNWTALAHYHTTQIEKYGLDTSGIAKALNNNIIWEVFFLHSNDKKELQKAAKWMELIVKADPYDAVNLDTYANVLYKAGYIVEAIKFQKIAIKLEPDDKGMKETLKNMQNREPTYVNLGAIWTEKTLPVKK